MSVIYDPDVSIAEYERALLVKPGQIWRCCGLGPRSAEYFVQVTQYPIISRDYANQNLLKKRYITEGIYVRSNSTGNFTITSNPNIWELVKNVDKIEIRNIWIELEKILCQN